MRHSHPSSKKLIEQLSSASSRQERIRILQRARQLARKEFPVQLSKLESLLLQYNPFMILATFAFVDLTYLPDIGRPMSDSGDIDQYHIELVQALILCHEEREFQMRLFDPVEFQELRDLISYVAYLHSAKDLPDPGDASSKEEFAQLHLRSMLRAHTKAVRNWGYEEQTINVLKRLYEPLEDAIEAELGVRISLVIDAVRAQLHSVGHRLQEHFTKSKTFMQPKTVEGAVKAYLKAFKDAGITVDKVSCLVKDNGWTFENVRIMLFHRSTSFLLTVLAFDIADFARACPTTTGKNVRQMLSSWTMELGELRDSNREHLFLANPIWSRPIIRATSNVLFWPIPTLFHGFCFDMIEAFVCKHPALKQKFLKRRGEFLEQYTSQLFQKKFPDAELFRGSKWDNRATNENGENDLLIVFDSIGLIVEEKSGAINAIARRGGASIKQEIEQLITEAAEQAHAFARLLQNDPRQYAFETEAGIVNRVDTSKIKQFYCLNITMERFGPLATQLPELQAAGLARKDVPSVPTMSLADLEIALELFETPFELLHYLTRRAAFEQHRKFVGDELDLLAFYLQTGFTEKTLPDLKRPLVINGLGSKLDKYFINWPGDNRFERPHRSLSKWWRQILSAIEKKHVHRRYELGCVLLDMPDEEQHAFEVQFRKLCKKVKRKKHMTLENIEAIWNHVKSEVSNAVVVAAPVTTEIYPKRNLVVENFASRGMSETGANQALVILVDVELEHWPYSGMYLLDKKDFKRRDLNL